MEWICPNCGARTTNSVCEYCGSTITPPKSKSDSQKEKDCTYIIPWPKEYESDDELIIKCFTQICDKKDAPVDVFNCITDVKVTRYYLPMRQFNGSISTDWSCIQVFDRERIVNYEIKDGKKKPIYESYEEYIPANGKGSGYFNIVVPTVAVEGLPKELVNFIHTTPINNKITDKAIPFASSTVNDKGIIIVDEAKNASNSKIRSRAEDSIEKTAYSVSFHHLSGRLKDCHYTYRKWFDSADNKKVLVPAVTVSYMYKGTEYCFALLLNNVSRDNYPKEKNNAFYDDVKQQSKKFTKTGWLIFAFSLILTIAIICLWGDTDVKANYLSTISIIGTIITTIIIAWKSLGISVTYDEIGKHGEALFAARRTDCLKKAFPQYANHPSVNKITTDEADSQSKIKRSYLKVRKNRILLYLLLLFQIIISVGVLVSIYLINSHNKDLIRAEIIGQTYTNDFTSLSLNYNGNGLHIIFLEGDKLTYKVTSNYGDTWSSSKTVPFNLEVKEWINGGEKQYIVTISFDNYYLDEVVTFSDKNPINTLA